MVLKKIMVSLLAVCMFFALAGCGGGEKKSADSKDAKPAANVKQAEAAPVSTPSPA